MSFGPVNKRVELESLDVLAKPFDRQTVVIVRNYGSQTKKADNSNLVTNATTILGNNKRGPTRMGSNERKQRERGRGNTQFARKNDKIIVASANNAACQSCRPALKAAATKARDQRENGRENERSK